MEKAPCKMGKITKLISNLLAKRMVDFEIRCGEHSFPVHRIVLASASSYFETVCAGGFKETEDGFMTSEVHPVYMAALILGVYSGFYIDQVEDSSDIARLGQLLLDGAHNGSSSDRAVYDLDDLQPSNVHAQMYKVADFHQIDYLNQRAAEQYLAAVQSPDFTIENLLDALGLLYDHTHGYTLNDTLRAVSVYMAQRMHSKITHAPRFEELMRCYPEFAWDFGTKYNHANWIYCPECKTEVILEECQCGFSGVCGYKFCTAQDFSRMRCTICGRKGHMTKHAPIAEKEIVEDVEAMTVADVLEEGDAHKVPISPVKKRKMRLASGA